LKKEKKRKEKLIFLNLIELVESILELKGCIHGLEESMLNKQYEKPAAHLHRYLTFDQKILDLVLSDASFQGSEMKKVLKNAETELKEIVNREFDVALKTGNEEAIVRYLKLFPFLNMGELALTQYGEYLASMVTSKADAELRGLRASELEKNHPVFADLCTKLFEHIANIIDAQEPIIDTNFAPGKMLYIVQILQRECDQKAKKILDVFKEHTHFNERVNTLRTTKSASEGLEPKELDVLLQEIVLISQTTEVYNDFLAQRVQNQLESVKIEEETDQQKQARLARLKRQGGIGWIREQMLNRLMQELLADYVFLEELFIKKSIEKALKIDEVEEGNIVSSSVDDVFFIFKKCITRVLRSGNVESFCAILNLIAKISEVDYLNAIITNLNSSANQNYYYLSENKVSKITQTVALNNLDLSVVYLKKLKTEVEANVQKQGLKSIEKIMFTLQQFNDSANQFVANLDAGLEQLFSSSYKNQIRNLLNDNIKDAKYVLLDDEYEEQDLKESLFAKLITDFDKNSKSFNASLTDNNHMKMVNLTLQYSLSEIEKHVTSKLKFNQMGAMLFDKHVRGFASYFVNSYSWISRDKFTRINQISTLLNLGKVHEVYDYWGNNNANANNSGSTNLSWRLTANEVRLILALRIDFKTDDINKLKL